MAHCRADDAGRPDPRPLAHPEHCLQQLQFALHRLLAVHVSQPAGVHGGRLHHGQHHRRLHQAGGDHHRHGPAFKTARRLGGRALASDVWLKTCIATTPGAGDKFHKDGYNVAYGDYSVRWYGDTERWFIYWNPPSFTTSKSTAINGSIDAYQWHGGLENSRDYIGQCTNGQYKLALLLTPLAWHEIDKAQGLDKDVDERSWFDSQNW